ncbi:MAG: hypothetical protein RQM95_08775 [Syntrophaceticus schinkii]
MTTIKSLKTRYEERNESRWFGVGKRRLERIMAAERTAESVIVTVLV